MDIYKQLGTKYAIKVASFFASFFQNTPIKQLMISPITTGISSIIYATIYSMIVTWIAGFVPDFFKPVISIIVIVSTIYYVTKGVKKRQSLR